VAENDSLDRSIAVDGPGSIPGSLSGCLHLASPGAAQAPGLASVVGKP
jgi:hypothetical protein